MRDKCTKKQEEPAKCANHTDNYKGCETFKKISSRTKPKAGTTKKENHLIQTFAVPAFPE